MRLKCEHQTAGEGQETDLGIQLHTKGRQKVAVSSEVHRKFCHFVDQHSSPDLSQCAQGYKTRQELRRRVHTDQSQIPELG